MYLKKYLLIHLLVYLVDAKDLNSFNVIKKVLNQCAIENEMFKCLKIQLLKAALRLDAFRADNLSIIDGVNLINSNRHSKALHPNLNLNESRLQNIDSEEFNQLLSDVSSRLLGSHHLEINIPRLLEEGRKKDKGGGNGALYWALAIKGSFLAIAYQGIAVMAGLAVIMGKIALLLSAILGLKKLVSSGPESTTLEIVKQPKYSEQHVYSNSHEDETHHRKSYNYIDNRWSPKHYKNAI